MLFDGLTEGPVHMVKGKGRNYRLTRSRDVEMVVKHDGEKNQ